MKRPFAFFLVYENNTTILLLYGECHVVMSGTTMSVLVSATDDGWSLAMPLWLPYVIFTIVLLSLIVVSFARFHALRGAQYRNRQLADERSMGINGAKNGFVE